MARAGKIFAFGIVATVIILLGVVSSRVASPSRASLGVPHDGMRLSPAPRVLSGNDTLAASDPDPAREARVLTRQNLRTRRRRRDRHWNRGDRDRCRRRKPRDPRPASRPPSPRRRTRRRRLPQRLASARGLVLLRRRLLPRGHPRGRLPGCDFPAGLSPPPAISDSSGVPRGDLAAKLRGAFAASKPRSPRSNITARRTSPTTISPRYSRPGTPRVRLPVTWACFAARDGDPATLLRDPAYPRFRQSGPKEKAWGLSHMLTRAGLKVLIDVHNMPGGSSLGTYNGVYPAPPAFWDDARLMSPRSRGAPIDDAVVPRTPRGARAGVDGFTLLNEPAHMLPDKLETMKRWYVDAVEDYRKLIVAPARAAGEPTPRLYVNLIETAGWDVDQMADWIGSVFTPEERAEWVVLDVHTYVAWEAPSRDERGARTDPSSSGRSWRNSRVKKCPWRDRRREGRHREHRRLGVVLATHHDSRVGCSDPATLRAVFHAETSAFLDAGASSYFWGGKCRAEALPFLLGLVTLSRGRGRLDALCAVRVVDVVHRFVDVVHRVSPPPRLISTPPPLRVKATSRSSSSNPRLTRRSRRTNAATADAEAIVDRDELANGYRAMSVEPAKQGEGRVTEMLAAAAEEQAERGAAAERETAGGRPGPRCGSARRRRGAERGYGNRRAGPIARRRDVDGVSGRLRLVDRFGFDDERGRRRGGGGGGGSPGVCGRRDERRGGGGETFDGPLTRRPPHGQEWGSTAEPQPITPPRGTASCTIQTREWGHENRKSRHVVDGRL